MKLHGKLSFNKNGNKVLNFYLFRHTLGRSDGVLDLQFCGIQFFVVVALINEKTLMPRFCTENT